MEWAVLLHPVATVRFDGKTGFREYQRMELLQFLYMSHPTTEGLFDCEKKKAHR